LPPDVKAPAPPPLENRPQPPAAPDPEVIALYEKDPAGFPAAYIEWQKQKDKQTGNALKKEERRDDTAAEKTKKRSPTFDQFVTAALVTGLNLRQGSVFTMFAPSDNFLTSINVSLPITALKNMECAQRIVK